MDLPKSILNPSIQKDQKRLCLDHLSMTNYNEPCFHDSIFLNEQKYLSIYNLLIKSLVFSTSTMESGKPEPKTSVTVRKDTTKRMHVPNSDEIKFLSLL